MQPVRQPGPGDARQIEQFCSSNYAITFPMFAKIDVNGSARIQLYQYLKNEQSGLLGSSIKWNFTKFLVDRAGKVVARLCADRQAGRTHQRIEHCCEREKRRYCRPTARPPFDRSEKPLLQ